MLLATSSESGTGPTRRVSLRGPAAARGRWRRGGDAAVPLLRPFERMTPTALGLSTFRPAAAARPGPSDYPRSAPRRRRDPRSLAISAQPRSTTLECRPPPLPRRYDDLANVDQLHATLAKVETVKIVMQDSIELALANCVSLEAIDQKADELQSQAGMFKTRAKKLRSQMWWKKCKMQLLIAFVVIAIIGVLIVIIMAYTGQFDKDKKKK